MYKQVILVISDLKLSKGKLAVQVAHASVDNVFKTSKKILVEWENEGMKKIVLKVANEKELLEYKKQAENIKLNTSLISDAGKTEVTPGTITCLAIGPDLEEKIDKVTGKLKTL